MKYRKKPVVIEAICYDNSIGIVSKIIEWMYPKIVRISHAGLLIQTLEGEMLASRGDWIIKGIKGEFYPCRPDIFELTYEAVNEQT